jgi:RNA polymerase sigma-70 factor (ECF subfamily)
MSPDSVHADWLRSLVEARNGAAELRAWLIEQNRPFLLQLAHQELEAELQAKLGASDLVQETVMAAYEHFGQFLGGQPEELRGWLRQILLNHLANCRRHYRDTDKRQLDREVPLSPAWQSDGANNALADATESPSTQAIQNEQQQRLQQALLRLPEHYRQVLVWRSLEQLSFGEIADRLGRTADAVRMLWGRAIEALQQELGPNS